MTRPIKRRFKLEIRQINYIKKLLGIDKIKDVRVKEKTKFYWSCKKEDK